MKNIIETRDVNFWYGDFHALKNISMDIEENPWWLSSARRDVASLPSFVC